MPIEGFRVISRERARPDGFAAGHPLHRIRSIVDAPLGAYHRWLELVCPCPSRVSIAPAQMMRALLLQWLYSIARNRELIERIWDSKLLRDFVGVQADEVRWNQAAFGDYRRQMLDHEIVRRLLADVVAQAEREGLLGERGLDRRHARDWRCVLPELDRAGQRRRGPGREPLTRRACDCGLRIEAICEPIEEKRPYTITLVTSRGTMAVVA